MIFKKYLIVFLALSFSLNAQQRANQAKKEIPVLHEVSNKDIVQSVYPDAIKVDKINNFWFRILDGNNQVLGFAMSSSPYCKDVIGYNDVTPIMIITDKKWTIQKVSLLTHYETISYVKRLEKKGFFNLWVGKTLAEAKKVELDGYTGATCTAIAVSKNINYLLENGVKVLPKK